MALNQTSMWLEGMFFNRGISVGLVEQRLLHYADFHAAFGGGSMWEGWFGHFDPRDWQPVHRPELKKDTGYDKFGLTEM